ncbi:hypothetical protein MVEN_02211300 [Mycena venus]|uniref:F-box domain-containing protein n=1 Tax=Mycena venus TaxID=2733690 RepID=A0A8H6X7J3_9AGAR|nr:hypothetical protein MVEN_02211300 [Mycena venus]
MADAKTIHDTLANIPPVILQSNIWKWHHLPYTILRQTLLRLFYVGAEEGVEWDQSASGEVQVNIDEWILGNEKRLRDADPLQWQHGLVTLDDAEHVFPAYVLEKSKRFIARPDCLTGFSILSLASGPRIAIQPSTAAFKRNFYTMSDGLLQNLDWSNVIVAGGIILGCLMAEKGRRHQWSSSDIDIYIYGLSSDDATKKIHHIFDTFCSNMPAGTRTFAVRNSKTITFYAKYPLRRIQIVLKLLESPREVLLNFDLDICAMGWDGSNVWMLPRAARALETGSNVFTMNLIHGHYLSERRASQPQRVFKYATRGYGLRFLPSYVSSLQRRKNIPGNGAPPNGNLNLELLANETRVWTRNWLRATFNHPLHTLSPVVLPGYSLSGFAMLMRPVTLWEMGRAGELTVLDEWSNTFPYEDIPAQFPDPEYPWDERFTIKGYMTHIHRSNVKEVTRWIRTDPDRLRRHGVQFGHEISDVVQRVSGAPTLELLLHPQHDLCLPVILPCTFAVYANDAVSLALANAGLKERKMLEPAVPGLDRRIDEIFEVLHAFRRANASLAGEDMQAQRFSRELSRRVARRKEESEFDSFARALFMAFQSTTASGHPVSYTVSPSTNEVLRNNGTPDESQTREIRDSLTAAQAVRASLAPQIIEAELRLLHLQRLDENAAQHIQRSIGALSLVRRLPAEMVSRIFAFHQKNCFPIEFPHLGETSTFDTQEMWRAGMICRKWRAIALDTGELWSTFIFQCSGDPRKEEAARTWLERTGNHLLTFTFNCPGHPTNDGGCRSVFDMLLSKCNRWKDAQFKLSAPLLQALNSVRANVPNLEKLDISLSSSSSLDAIDAFSNAPRLRDLNLSAVLPNVIMELPWAQITHYQGDEFDPEHNHVLNLAQNMRSFVLNSRSRGLTAPLIHSQMRNLSIICSNNTLANLEVPALEDLRFPLSEAQAVKSLLERSNCAITELRIDGFDPREWEILRVFAATPALASLTLFGDSRYSLDSTVEDTFGRSTAEQFYTRIAEADDPVLLPNLRRLFVNNVLLTDAFMKMVESRRVAAGGTVALESLSVSNFVVYVAEDTSMSARLSALGNFVEVTIGRKWFRAHH